MTDWIEAMEIVISRTLHERYRVLCADDYPDHDAYRRIVTEMASEPWPPAAEPMADAAEEARRRRAGKPRIALGVDQHRLPPPGCVECREKKP